MAKQTLIQSNFNSGLWSGRMAGRADLAKYQSACKTLQNFLVWPQGGAFKRPGSKYIAEVPNSDNITRLIPFLYSDTDAYILEFSDLLIRFFRTVSGVSGLILDDDGSTVTNIVSPYPSADLALLQFAQTGDVMYNTQPDYHPRRLIRTDHNSWAIEEVNFVYGPFLSENDTDTTIWTRTYEIDTVNAGAGGSFVISGEGDLSNYIEPASIIRVFGGSVAANKRNFTVADVAYVAPDFTITVIASESVTADGAPTCKVRPDRSNGRLLKLRSSAPLFNSEHVGALWQLKFPQSSQAVNGSFTSATTSSTIEVAYNQKLDLYTHGTWTGTLVLEVSYDGGTMWDTIYQVSYVADGNVELHELNDVEDAIYRLNMTAYTSGTCKYNLVTQSFKKPGIVEIETVTDSNNVEGRVVVDFGDGNSLTTLWAEGAWSDYRGYPAAVTFFEQRIWFGGSSYEPATLWASKSLPGGDYHNFQAGPNDDEAIVFTMAEAQQDPIKWLTAGSRLIVGTAGGEYTLGASNATEPITPTNVNHPQQAGIQGSASLMPVKTAVGYLFVERGSRKVNELAYNWEKDQLVAVDMTRLANEITEGGIKEIAFQKRPEPILWAVTNEGKLISLIYLREEDVVCWAEHVTAGNYESVAVIPGDPEDEVWFVVNRTIDGVTKRYVEKLMPWDWGDDQEDAFFVDCGLTYDSTPTTTITGLSHLEGETVAILADGGAHPSKVVSGGQITLDRSASVVQVGLPYTSIVETMKMPYGTLALGSPKRISHIAAMFYKTGYAQFGRDTSHLEEIEFREGPDLMDTAVPLYTGTKALNFPGGFDTESTLVISSDKPLPLAVTALVLLAEVA